MCPYVCGLCLFLFTKGPNLRFRAQVSGLLQPATLQPATCGILPSEILKQAGYSALHCLPRFPLLPALVIPALVVIPALAPTGVMVVVP